MLKVAPPGKRVQKGGISRTLISGATPAFTGRAVLEDFAFTPRRHERGFRSQISSRGALTGNAFPENRDVHVGLSPVGVIHPWRAGDALIMHSLG